MDTRNVLHDLRQLNFPECTLAALEYLALSVSSHKQLPITDVHSDDMEEKVVREFVFLLHINKKVRLVPELQVTDILLKFFSCQTSEVTRHLLLNLLFGHSAEDHGKVLFKLISLSISLQNVAVLDSAAIWLQAQCCNEVATSLVMHVIHDYTNVMTRSVAGFLRQLPKISSHFACSFLTIMTCTFALPGMETTKPVLTEFLLELVCDWLKLEPQLSLTPLYQLHTQYSQYQQATLWTSPRKPNMQTPIPGLVRWCCQAPLVVQGCLTMSYDVDRLAPLWSCLHFHVLQTFLAFPLLLGSQQLELITLADMDQTVKVIVAEVNAASPCNALYATLAIDRLVQILQVALCTGAFRCSLGDLHDICQCLPSSRLLKIVERHHLSFAPPLMHNAS